MTPEEVSATLASLDQLLKSINNRINSVLGNILINLVPFAKTAIQWIHDRIADISHTIEPIIGHIVGTVTGAIGAIVPTAVDFLVGIVNDVFNDVHSILGNLATAEEFVGGAIGEISRHSIKLGEFAVGAIGNGLSGGILDVLKFLEGQEPAMINHFLEEVLRAKSLPAWLKTMVEGLHGRGAEWQALALPLLVGVLLQPIGEALVNPLLVELTQQENSRYRTQVNTPPELVEQRLKGVIAQPRFETEMAYNNLDATRSSELLAARSQRLQAPEINVLRFRGEISENLAASDAAQQGLDKERLDLKREALRPLLSEDEIRQTFLRGIIDRPKHDALMSLHGYTQDTINRKVNLYFLIPGPQDLIHMGIRNVFDPVIVEKFNLAGDAPEAFFAAAAQQGISKDWALKFWEAHWIVPGTDQAFTMYQRTVDKPLEPGADEITLLDGTRVYNIIGRSTLNLFLKDKDTPPYYREKLTEIAYHPLNRIDVRRMYSVGSLSKAGVQRAYLDLGYSPAHALQIAGFVEKFYASANKKQAEPLLQNLRREAIRLYIQNKLSFEQIGFVLTDMGFTETETSYLVAEADLIRHAQVAEQIEKGVAKLYTGFFITEDDARKRLSNAGTPKEAIDAFVNRWNIDREFKVDSEHFHKQRDLTKAEAAEAYSDGLMHEDDFLTFMEYLGYPEAEAQIELGLANYRRDRATRTATEDALKALYVNGLQDDVTTSNALDAAGTMAQRRDALIAQWRLQRETRTERLPIATLRDMFRAGFYSPEITFIHLKRHRFTDGDAQDLIDFWASTKK